MHENDWIDVLCKTNFNGGELVLPGSDDLKVHAQSLIISTALAPSAKETQHPKTIIVTSGETPSSSLLESLDSALKELSIHQCPIVDIVDVKQLDLKDTICIVLIECQKPLLLDIVESSFEGVRYLLNTCSGLIWLTTNTVQDPQAALANGLVRTARWERDLDHVNLVLLEILDSTLSVTQLVSKISQIYQLHFIEKSARNSEYRLSQGILEINRLVDARHVNEAAWKTTQSVPVVEAFGHDPSRGLMLTTRRPGLLTELHWADWPEFNTPLRLGEIEVEMKAMGLNFLDIMVAMGEVPRSILGGEGSGVVSQIAPDVTKFRIGDRVLLSSAGSNGCFQTYTRIPQDIAEKIPDEMPFEIAAGLPVIYLTAYYSIHEIARLQKGESILIHAAAGGLGQASIILAQNVGAEIFATVSSEVKRAVLMDTYGIPEDHIFSSRDLSFVKGVMRMTNNRGVDVALNSLSGEFLRRTWDCMAPMGRFIEVGKKDVFANGKLDMFPFSKSVTFATFMLDTFGEVDPKGFNRLLQIIVSLWQEGKIRPPTPYTVSTLYRLEEEFRSMQAGQHVGKIILTANKDDLIKVSHPSERYSIQIKANQLDRPQSPNTTSIRRVCFFRACRWHWRTGSKHGTMDGSTRRQKHCSLVPLRCEER
jgi:NADPH:quinone reductase-like Zn-dependent oxidoreductase